MSIARLPLLIACVGFAAAIDVRAEPTGASAACDAVGGNFLANCGFETGDPPTGWSGFGTLSRDTTAPHSGAASLRVVSQVFVNDQALANANSNCFRLVPGRSYSYGGWARLLSNTAATACGAFVVVFADSACTEQFTTADSTGVAFAGPSSWQAFGRTFSSPFARSGFLQASCDGGGVDDSFTAGFDDLFFVAAVDGIFGNGFE